MDISYILMALEKIKDERAGVSVIAGSRALTWTIEYLEANRDDIDDFLEDDDERGQP